MKVKAYVDTEVEANIDRITLDNKLVVSADKKPPVSSIRLNFTYLPEKPNDVVPIQLQMDIPKGLALAVSDEIRRVMRST